MARDNQKPIPLTRRKQPLLLTQRKSRAPRNVMAPARTRHVPELPLEAAPRARRTGAAPEQRRVLPSEACTRWPDLIRIGLHSEHNFFCGFSRELESSGIFVATYTAVPLGEVMVVNFVVPGRVGAADAVCEARWIREHSDRTADVTPGVGFGFVRIDDDVLRAVSHFMSIREPIFWEV
jgi:hypothetical protein